MARPWQPRPLSAAFLQLREEWLRARPFPHFLAGESQAPTYGVELDLDHARSYLAGMFEEFAAGNPHFRFAERIEEDREELRRLAAELADCHAPEDAAAPLRGYIATTNRLLDAFAGEHAAWAAAQPTAAQRRAPAV